MSLFDPLKTIQAVSLVNSWICDSDDFILKSCRSLLFYCGVPHLPAYAPQTSAKMSQPQEKALKNIVIVNETGEVPVISKITQHDGDVSGYTESKRTWKSYLWSSRSSQRLFNE